MNKPEFVADTMALVLRIEKRRMPQRARTIFEQAPNYTTASLLELPGCWVVS